MRAHGNRANIPIARMFRGVHRRNFGFSYSPPTGERIGGARNWQGGEGATQNGTPEILRKWLKGDTVGMVNIEVVDGATIAQSDNGFVGI